MHVCSMLDARLKGQDIFIDDRAGLRSQLVDERARHVEIVGMRKITHVDEVMLGSRILFVVPPLEVLC